MHTFFVIAHLFLAIGLIVFVLIQHGKGADAGAAFGGGASGSVFGAKGSSNFLSRTTAVLATLFFLTSMTLAWYEISSGRAQGLMSSQDNDVSELSIVEPAAQGDNEVPIVPESIASEVGEIPVVADTSVVEEIVTPIATEEPVVDGELPAVKE